jgi:2-C-methyl-D-erythritol 4-phosphate cytidylyltransferase
MGNDMPKQFIPLKGRPVLMYTLDCFYRWNQEIDIILVLPEEHQTYWRMLCKELSYTTPHQIIVGGESRFHSVKNGLTLVKEPGMVAVHDGVRPFVSQEVIAECFTKAEKQGTAIPVLPLVESIRLISEDGKSKLTDRSCFVSVQTPQVFNSEILTESYTLPCMPEFTDDASVVEAMGYDIHTVIGNRENIKITTLADLLFAEAFLSKT